MKLLAISFAHFRCLYDTGWIPLKDLSIFIGENDAGKSAALDGIQLLLAQGRPISADISLKPGLPAQDEEPQREDFFEISGRFHVTDPAEAAQLHLPQDADGSYVIALRFSSEGPKWFAVGMVPTDPDLQIEPHNTPLARLKEIISQKGYPNPHGSAKPPYIQVLESKIAASPKTREYLALTAPPHRQSFEIVDFRTAQEASVILNEALRSLFRSLIRANRYQQLESVQRRVSRELQQKADELTEFVQKYRSDITNVRVTATVDFANGFQGVSIELSDRRGVPIELRGQGLHAHLRLAAFDWSKSVLASLNGPTRIFLLDEPDTHLDYQAQRRMLAVMEGFAQRGQVLVATHSLNLINRVPLDRIIHFELDRSLGQSQLRTIIAPAGTESEEIDRIGSSLGLENATVLYERAFFLFEGQTEARALPLMYEKAMDSKWYLDGVRFVNGTNDQGAILFAKFLHTNGRPVIAFVDQDITTRREFKKQFSKTRLETQAQLPADRIYTIGPKCFELAFPSAAWVRAIYRATKGKHRPVRARLDALKQTPEAFLDYLESASGGLSKPELGSALATVVRKNEIPAVLMSAFERAKTLAS